MIVTLRRLPSQRRLSLLQGLHVAGLLTVRSILTTIYWSPKSKLHVT